MTIYDAALLVAVLAASGAVGFVAGRFAHVVLRRTVARAAGAWGDVTVPLRAPLVFGAFVIASRVALAVTPLDESLQRFASELSSALFYVALYFFLARLVDVGRAVLERTGAKDRREALSLVQIGGRILKVAILALCALALLAHFGFSVATLVAGLGLGGLAIGLAAQKTLENVFGAVSLALDRPLRAGDYVKVGDHLGTVETIGLRSTTLRTLDRTVVSIPNGDLANTRIENFALRDRMRLSCTVGLVYSTPPSAIRVIRDGLEKVLRDHPKIWPDNVQVRLVAFGASSLDLEVMAWFLTSEWTEFWQIREEVMLSFMQVVEAGGSSFAFPSQSLYVEQLPRASPPS